MAKFTIILDYGMSNLHSIYAACKKNNINCKVSSNKSDLETAAAIILPGVGAFPKAITNLEELDLIDPLKKQIKKGKPFFGICLGMQLLFNSSEEFKKTNGLSIISGKVKRFDKKYLPFDQIPHTGWNTICKTENIHKTSILQNIENNVFMYFVHSYYVLPNDKTIITTYTKYGKYKFCSSLRFNNVFATQFHPEKSGKNGLKVIKEFKTSFKL